MKHLYHYGEINSLPACFLGHFVWICTGIELSLWKQNWIFENVDQKKSPKLFYFVFPHFEKLDSNAGKHKIQKHGDQYNISNGLNSNKYTLDNML